VIVDPLGKVLAGPIAEQEGILYADADLDAALRSRREFDVVGHYARPDVFQLRVNRG
jgi:nitrilase